MSLQTATEVAPAVIIDQADLLELDGASIVPPRIAAVVAKLEAYGKKYNPDLIARVIDLDNGGFNQTIVANRAGASQECVADILHANSFCS